MKYLISTDFALRCWTVGTTVKIKTRILPSRRIHLERQNICYIYDSSVQFSRSVLSDSATSWIAARRPPCPSPAPGVHWNSCPSSQWCHPAISSSVVPFSSCPQSLLASESFPMSQLFAWGGQNGGRNSQWMWSFIEHLDSRACVCRCVQYNGPHSSLRPQGGTNLTRSWYLTE